MQARDTFNLEQVEIIKGPDSIHGRGGADGSINMVSKAPKAKDAIEAIPASPAPIATTEQPSTATGDWAKKSAPLERHGRQRRRAGPRQGDDFERWGGNATPSLTLGMGTPTRITLSYYHYQNDSMPDYSIPYDPQVGLPV